MQGREKKDEERESQPKIQKWEIEKEKDQTLFVNGFFLPSLSTRDRHDDSSLVQIRRLVRILPFLFFFQMFCGLLQSPNCLSGIFVLSFIYLIN